MGDIAQNAHAEDMPLIKILFLLFIFSNYIMKKCYNYGVH